MVSRTRWWRAASEVEQLDVAQGLGELVDQRVAFALRDARSQLVCDLVQGDVEPGVLDMTQGEIPERVSGALDECREFRLAGDQQ
ncbi:hypothetical protein A6A28_05565 [Streptomyces sp. CB03578]|nr:hypothetical protein A6A28_05565 [Streptomyces sp. CB03578]